MRAKQKVFDIGRSNQWEWFVTITFDPEMVNSFKYEDCQKKITFWLNNIRKRYCPDMVYIIVPELHKSGRYHFHGLLSCCDGLQFEDSGHKTKDGEIIYNIGKYKLGFTTATKVKDPNRVQKYIGKYITKELAGSTQGKKRYWRSKNCNVPEIEYYFNNAENHMDLHDNLISRKDYQFGQEKTYEDENGCEQYIRYYEFGGKSNES